MEQSDLPSVDDSSPSKGRRIPYLWEQIEKLHLSEQGCPGPVGPLIEKTTGSDYQKLVGSAKTEYEMVCLRCGYEW